MTLISAFNIDLSPVVVGDLLISGPENSENSTEIPVLGDVTQVFPAGSGWSIIGLQQKVNVIANNCVIAWAGSQLAASIIIKELRNISSKAPLCFNSISEYFSSLTPDILKFSVSFVGWVQESNGFRRFWFESQNIKTAFFGDISVAGTGASAFLELAGAMPKNFPTADRKINSLEKAVSASLMSTGLMLQSELYTQNNLLNFFGGGYEISTFVRDKFSKIGDITFVFWTAEVNGSSINLSLPCLALKQDYLEEILLIRSVRIQYPKGYSEPPHLEESLHAVSPIYQNATQDQLNKLTIPEMNSRFTCHYILVHSDGPIQVLGRVEYRENRSPTSIVFTDNPEHILFSINQDFISGLAQSIRKQYKCNI